VPHKTKRAFTPPPPPSNNCELSSHFIVTIYTHILYCGLSKRKAMNRIKEVLEEQGRSQKWLATQISKSYNMVNAYVQNRQQPRLEILFEIAKVLGVDPKQLLKSEDSEK